MKKNFGAFGAGQFSLETLVGGRPGTTIFRNPGGGAGGGRIQGPGPAAPPCPFGTQLIPNVTASFRAPEQSRVPNKSPTLLYRQVASDEARRRAVGYGTHLPPTLHRQRNVPLQMQSRLWVGWSGRGAR